MSKLSSLHIVETNRAYGIENHIFILPTYNKWGVGIQIKVCHPAPPHPPPPPKKKTDFNASY